MPISAARTLELFGYPSDDITPGMAKKVACVCATCGCEFIIIRKNLNEHCVCRKCAFKLIPKENYKRGVEKRKSTCMTKYGQESKPFDESSKVKRRETNMSRFGSTTPQGNAEIRAKTEATNLARYGVRSAVALPSVREKSRKTMMERFGAEHTLQVPELRAKAAKTNLDRYGVENASLSPKLRVKRAKTTLEKYGTLTPQGYGGSQRELHTLLDDWGIKNIQCDLTLDDGKSIDYFDPNSRVGIEYCGLYWHNEYSPTPRGRTYHFNKMQTAMTRGMRLITLFEDEWLTRRKQVENVLRSIFHISSNRVGARECSIDILESTDANAFIETHHLQGKAPNVLFAAGLRKDGNLLGAITLGRHHRQGQNDLVLNRLCFASDVHVAGGAAKLFSAVTAWAHVNNHTKIISWSDNRWFAGNVYAKLGFELAEELPPDYTYVVRKRPIARLSKQSQKKSSVDCPPGLTEHEWATQRGLARVWDCGHKRWELAL